MGTGDSDSIGIADIQSKNAQTLTDIQMQDLIADSKRRLHFDYYHELYVHV